MLQNLLDECSQTWSTTNLGRDKSSRPAQRQKCVHDANYVYQDQEIICAKCGLVLENIILAENLKGSQCFQFITNDNAVIPKKVMCQFEELVEANNYSNNIIQTTKHLFHKYFSKKIQKNHSHERYIIYLGICLYESCLKHKAPRLEEEICRHLGCKYKLFGKYINLFRMENGITSMINPLQLAPRIVTEYLRFPKNMQAKFFKALQKNDFVKLYTTIRSGLSPLTYVVVLICYFVEAERKQNNHDLPRCEQICKKLGIMFHRIKPYLA